MSINVHRPAVSAACAQKLAEKFYNFEQITDIKELVSYMDRNFYIRGRRRGNSSINQDNSEKLADITAEEGEYVLKILNSFDSKNGDSVNAENEAMLFLRERNFPCPLIYPIAGSPALKLRVHVPASLHSIDEAYRSVMEDDNTRNTSTTEECIIRLMSFLPGVTASSSGKLSYENLFCIGQFVGRLSRTLQEFQCPVLSWKLDRWSIENFLSLEEYITFVADDENKRLIREVLRRFATRVSPKLSLLRSGILHHDVSRSNLLLDLNEASFKISGLVDFGDMRRSFLLVELATTMASFIDKNDVLVNSSPLLSGYQASFPLMDTEFELLYDMISVRLCQVYLITSKEVRRFPENEYLREILMSYETKLRAWLKNSEQEVMIFWGNVGLGDGLGIN